MSATETLRQMLAEHGIEYEESDPILTSASGLIDVTFWRDRDGYPCTALEGADDVRPGSLGVNMSLTPEQVITVITGERTTTRNGKCVRRHYRNVPLCECCGQAIGDERYNYCPKCGARIVE